MLLSVEFIPLFNYWSDIKQVLLMLNVGRYNPNSWRLFIDSSQCSLKSLWTCEFSTGYTE